MGVSSRTDAASVSHHEKNASTIGRDLLSRIFSFFFRGRIAEGALDAEQGADETESDFRALGIRIERLEEVPPGVGPAIDLDDVSGCVQVVVDHVGIRDEEPLVAGKHVVDGIARMVTRGRPKA